MKKTGGQLLQSLFDVNHPFWQSVEKVFTIFLLNICFVVTSLPVLTFGIARLALFASLDILRKEGKVAVLAIYPVMVKRYWKQGLTLGLLEGLLVGVCILNLFLTSGVTSLPIQILRLVCFATLIFSQLMIPYLYRVASQVELPLVQLGLTALMQSARNLWLTLAIVVVLLVLVFVAFFNGLTFLVVLSLLATFGYAGLVYLFLLYYKS
ncbi:TPA: DUF624 domain-containing protein [Streptococcus suis]